MSVLLITFYARVRKATGWAPTSYKWSYNPYKLPYKWVNGLITPISGVITSFITGRGPTLQVQKKKGTYTIQVLSSDLFGGFK